MLNDVLIELGQIAQVHAALLGERLGLEHAVTQGLDNDGDDEDHGAENACRRVL